MAGCTACSPRPGCLPACRPAWPPWASWPEAQCSAVGPLPGRWAPGWATPFPPLCLPLQTGSLSGPQTVSSPPQFSPFNTALLGSEALRVSFLPCCKLPPVSRWLRTLVQSQIVLEAPPLPGSPTSQQSQEYLTCPASLSAQRPFPGDVQDSTCSLSSTEGPVSRPSSV